MQNTLYNYNVGAITDSKNIFFSKIILFINNKKIKGVALN